MSLEGQKIINIGGVELVDRPANINFTTDAIEFRMDHMWSLQVYFLGAVSGTPRLSIECSNNQVDWLRYKAAATNIDLVSVNNRLIFDESFPPRYMRIRYNANGNTATNINLILIVKKDR